MGDHLSDFGLFGCQVSTGQEFDTKHPTNFLPRVVRDTEESHFAFNPSSNSGNSSFRLCVFCVSAVIGFAADCLTAEDAETRGTRTE
jgi:hypothetical protein